MVDYTRLVQGVLLRGIFSHLLLQKTGPKTCFACSEVAMTCYMLAGAAEVHAATAALVAANQSYAIQ